MSNLSQHYSIAMISKFIYNLEEVKEDENILEKKNIIENELERVYQVINNSSILKDFIRKEFISNLNFPSYKQVITRSILNLRENIKQECDLIFNILSSDFEIIDNKTNIYEWILGFLFLRTYGFDNEILTTFENGFLIRGSISNFYLDNEIESEIESDIKIESIKKFNFVINNILPKRKININISFAKGNLGNLLKYAFYDDNFLLKIYHLFSDCSHFEEKYIQKLQDFKNNKENEIVDTLSIKNNLIPKDIVKFVINRMLFPDFLTLKEKEEQLLKNFQKKRNNFFLKSEVLPKEQIEIRFILMLRNLVYTQLNIRENRIKLITLIFELLMTEYGKNLLKENLKFKECCKSKKQELINELRENNLTECHLYNLLTSLNFN